ncbi:phosphate acyltransferase PlsX [Campylobacter sp. VBCF_05 NA6]|uniref:phosphate acyltransferase PlsX n=1 Tax=unclassified Campylobacter TaxID=2593542 RepID=UPI0022EA078F|nr:MULTISPECIES: phosphate acyltransferase PlsX [unclassified Campylobacter]MDA3058161.1 phosphate acyltransferase PlsX [Campylobacter sp. VBCF_04 NA7]MDA3059732.1 phosphate acyltransferase PlsX [Campylobacter sp. VBCF_05 NA6]
MTSIAIDAMGGDFGCEPIVCGVIEALREQKFKAFLVGDEAKIAPFIPAEFQKYIEYVQTDEVFEMKEGATDVLKRKNSTIYQAVDLVRNGTCKAVVSAGHSGATHSLATLRIGRIPGISRPAIATLFPTSQGGKTLVLDVGANVDCKPENLFEFAVMGEAYAKEIMGIKIPRIGLLSNGEEDSKGNEVNKEIFPKLKKMQNFVGNAEGNQIFDGSVDVVITDGFIGNIVLKTSEGIASAMNKLIKKEAKKSPIAIAGSILMRRVFKIIKKSTDYDETGGAPLLGVKECVIISHGKSTPKAIKNAIFQALKFSDSNINSVIQTQLSNYNQG